MNKLKTTLMTGMVLGLCMTFVGCGGGGGGGDDGDVQQNETTANVSGDWDVTIDFGQGYLFTYEDVGLEQNGNTLSGIWAKTTRNSIAQVTGAVYGNQIDMNFINTMLKSSLQMEFNGTVHSSTSMSGDATSYMTDDPYECKWTATKK
jgi:hypothetical protein